MNIKEKLNLDRDGLTKHGPVNIVILGDSVSHGAIVDNLDYENVYWNRLRKMLNCYRDYVPVNMICASIGGTIAKNALDRLDTQVLNHTPDLVIVSFGLNDVNHSLEDYLASLQIIFEKCTAAGAEVIFMTPNMLNTYVAEGTAEKHINYAHTTAQHQNSGRMDMFIEQAIALASRMGITVCDCYRKWKTLSLTQDTTQLLANRINHPLPEMHQLFADSLYDIIIGRNTSQNDSASTMFITDNKD